MSAISWRGASRNHLLGAIFCGALVVLFSLVLLARDPFVFWNDDYQVSILPVFADVARSWSEGEFPLLSPYSWVCGNLAGEYQYGTFSIFVNALVVLIWKLPLSFPQQAAALSISHLFVLAMGGYMLARARNLAMPLALTVGLVTALNGWIICWGATDWLGALAALAWLPWAWWGLERALDSRRGPARFLWPVPFVYLLIAGGFPYTVVMLALLAAWLSIKAIAQKRSLMCIWPLALGMLLGIGLSASAWLALVDYLAGSARQAQDSSAHFQWIVPPAALPGFILPSWTVNWSDFSTRLRPHGASEMACGLVAPAILLFALAMRPKLLVRQMGWELSLLAVVLVASMLPTANVFRWSFRWLPFLHLILVLIAVEVWQLLAADRRKILISACGLVLVTTGAMVLFGAGGQYGWQLAVIFFLLTLAWNLTSSSWSLPVLTFCSLLATYLVIPSTNGVPRYKLDPHLTSPAPLDPERLYLSLYPATEDAYRAENRPNPAGMVVRMGSTSMWAGIHLLNGYSPIRPAGVAREFETAIHGEVAPWVADYFPESKAGPEGELAQIGIDGIIVAAELTVVPKPEVEWPLVYSSGEGRVYHRRGGPFPRIRSLGSAQVRVVENSRHRAIAEITASSDGTSSQIAFSRPYFTGYRAYLNDRELKVTSIRSMYPIVEVPAGERGQLVLRYLPAWLIYGVIAAAVSGLLSLLAVFLLQTHYALRLFGNAEISPADVFANDAKDK